MFAYELPLSTSNVNSLNSEDIPTIEKLILNFKEKLGAELR